MNTVLIALLELHWTSWVGGALMIAGTVVVVGAYVSTSIAWVWRSLIAIWRTGSFQIRKAMQVTIEKTAEALIGPAPVVNRDIGAARLAAIVNAGVGRVNEIDRYQQSARTQLDAAEYSINFMLAEISRVMPLPGEPSQHDNNFASLMPKAQPISAIAA